jgi:hypothetical protein
MRVFHRDNVVLRTEIVDQISRIRSALLVGFSVGLLGTLGVFALHSHTRLPLGDFTRDPLAITQSKFYLGALSNIGIMLWSATAATCLFGAYLLSSYYNTSEFRWFLFSFGLLTLILALDDVFMFHEKLFPRHLRIPEKVVLLSYAVIATGCFLRFFKLIFRTNYLLLFLSLMFLGSSVFVDQTLPDSDHEVFLEDGLKFFGIVFWMAYFFNSTSEIIRKECLTTSPRVPKG